MTDASALPGSLEALRLKFLEQCAFLLEGQARSHALAAATTALTHGEHQAILGELAALKTGRLKKNTLQAITTRCRALEQTLALLADERRRRWLKNGDYVKAMMREFQGMLGELSGTLVEKSLLQRQSRVLESIILSYEKIAQWKTFIQEILADFHASFPFHLFLVAFREERALSLHFYFMDDYPDRLRAELRGRFTVQFLEMLGLPPNSAVDVEEYFVRETNSPEASLDARSAARQASRKEGASNAPPTVEEIQLVTVTLPPHLPHVTGILGVGYASVFPLSSQEQEAVRSMLAVMMMVVGSSKTLSRTLSELEYYSTHDPLTGLYNRRHFNEVLEYELGRSERHRHPFCLLFLDCDDFKDINDSYGHLSGDEVLRTIGETVRSSLRRSDLACRIGGDEFAVLLPETPLEGGLTAAEHLRERVTGLQFTAPSGKTFRTSVSIGVVSFPRDAQTLSELLASVDVSLYHAKVLGKNTVTSVDAAQGTVERTRAMRTHIEALRQALEGDRVVPYFQPILDCRGGRLYGYEALARLVEMDGQIKPAVSFVPIIERYGLAHELDQRILEKTLEEKARYLRAGGPPVKLFVNLCPQETQGRGILEFAEDLCTRLGVPPACLVFEISERDAIGDASRMRAFLTQLRQLGFAFALDDFGSGYKSFHSLRDLRFEYVKLDGTFVRDIVASGIDLALVRNLSHLCDDLGIRTIAKCVESAGILERLHELGVDYAQGYHLGLPQPHIGIHE